MMVEGNQKNSELDDEQAKIKAQSEAQMMRARLNDYIAIILGVGTVFLLWLLQWFGFY